VTRPVIVTCALTGGGNTTSASPHVPITPQQIAAEALAARSAGAAIVHIHVRDPETGEPSREVSLYREVVNRIRDAGSDVLINLTTGAGARFLPDDADPNRNSIAGMATPEERIRHVVELKPDICSLDIATMNFGPHAFVNIPAHIERIASAVREHGVKPELEVFDLGHVALAKHFCERGVFGSSPWMQLCLGIPWGAPATTEAMLAMKQALPSGALWSGFGISRHEFPMVAQAVILGGHARVGLEDNLYLAAGKLSPGNAPLVERAVRIIVELGEEVATPAQARDIIGLK
jgi:uncharacterized protein (DUF849 family)